MTTIGAEEIRAAAMRLRGHVVATPLIGIAWPTGPVMANDVRCKPELLQPGGSGWYRGYLHWLLRSLGSLPGVLFAGPSRRLLAASLAARQHRLPLTVLLTEEPTVAEQKWLAGAGAEVEVCDEPRARAEELRRSRGLLLFPGADEVDVAAGLATIGLELAEGLPAECVAVHAPGCVAESVGAGLAAGGRDLTVRPCEEQPSAAHEELAEVLLGGHGLSPSPAGLAVLAAARTEAGEDPIAALLLE